VTGRPNGAEHASLDMLFFSFEFDEIRVVNAKTVDQRTRAMV
jgi:hypothetical protein